LYKLYILEKFGFKYTDSDQSIMWLGAKDYSNGIFHEPRFYGQDYNTMLESLFSVPFLLLGFKVQLVLPLITSILTLFPFIIISFFTFVKKSNFAALFMLCIPLVLPIEYDLITCLSRGFVSGLFISSFCCLPLFFPESRFSFLIAGFAIITSYSINMNSVLYSIPVIILVIIKCYNTKYFLKYFVLGVFFGLLLHLLASQFYLNHPNYVLHAIHSTFSIKNFIYGVSHIDKYFSDVTPIFSRKGWITFVFLTIVGCLLIKQKKYREAIVLFLSILLLVIPFISSKVHDGNDSVFFPHSRMFLAVPLLLFTFSSFLTIKSKLSLFAIYGLTFIVLFNKIDNLNLTISKILKQNNVVAVAETQFLINECNKISSLAKKYDVDLIIINNYWMYDFINYACPACTERFPNTLRPDYERRTWRLIEERKIIHKNVFIIDFSRKLNLEFDFITAIASMQGFYVLKDNKITTIKLLKKLNIKLRKF